MVNVSFAFQSETLGRPAQINILLPQSTESYPKPCRPPFPVLYLLHGLCDDHNGWLRYSSVERYAERYNLCIVLPNTDRGFYTDTAYGSRYFHYISRELPQIVAAYFPVSHKREDTFACGLSMGGYGALKLGLRCPERFAAVAALSAAPIGRLMQEENRKRHKGGLSELEQEMQTVFGETPKPEDDIFALCEHSAQAPQKPKIFVCCGEDDFLFSLNLALKAKIVQCGYALTWRQSPGAAHDWAYWDQMLPDVLAWLPLQGAEA